MTSATSRTFSESKALPTTGKKIDTTLLSIPPSIDIFCRVVDNYGDIGVCWRLACNLLQTIHLYPDLPLVKLIAEAASQHQHEHQRQSPQFLPLIRLWVDDLKSFRRIQPLIDTQQSIQTLAISSAMLATPCGALHTQSHRSLAISSTKLATRCTSVSHQDIDSGPSLENAKNSGYALSSESVQISTAEYACLIGFIQIHAWDQASERKEIINKDAFCDNPLIPSNGKTVKQNQLSKQVTPAPISIEAFACELDPDYIAAMPGHTKYWFNLEYLSAEDWVNSFHAQASLQNNGVAKYFFFPGFTQNTGGLLRETNLLTRQSDFLNNPQAQADWLSQYMGEDVCQAWQDGARLISFFSYPHAPIEALFHALLVSEEDHILLMPHGVVPEAEAMLETLQYQQVKASVNKQVLYSANIHNSPNLSNEAALGQVIDVNQNKSNQKKLMNFSSGKVRIHRFEFIEQYQFDYLLSLCDMNFVRGEDSFVRAIWAAKPFVWHIYPQAEQAHIDKLNAWLDSYPMRSDYRKLLLAWNRNASADTETCQGILLELFTLPSVRHDFQALAKEYRDFLQQNPTLSFSLLSFQPKKT